METINLRSTGLTMVDKVLTRGRQMAVDNWSTTVDKVDKLSTKNFVDTMCRLGKPTDGAQFGVSSTVAFSFFNPLPTPGNRP